MSETYDRLIAGYAAARNLCHKHNGDELRGEIVAVQLGRGARRALLMDRDTWAQCLEMRVHEVRRVLGVPVEDGDVPDWTVRLVIDYRQSAALVNLSDPRNSVVRAMQRPHKANHDFSLAPTDQP